MYRLSRQPWRQFLFDANDGGGGGGGDKPWFDGKGLDAEAVGYFETRGWTKDATVAAIEASKAHREANRFLGVPADQLLRIPKADDKAAWEVVHQRFGKPADAKEYDFSGVKRADGSALAEGLVENLRKTAAALNLPKALAPDLAKSVMAVLNEADTFAKAEETVKLAKEKDALHDNWKAGFEVNMLIAQRTARTLGISEEQLNALEKVTGYASTMNLLRQLGTVIGEDKFLGGGPGGGPKIMTKEMATAKHAELMADKDWSQRYFAGGTAEKHEMQELTSIITGHKF